METDWVAATTCALAVLAANGRVAPLREFLAAGLTRHQVAALFRMGAIRRPRKGWYADAALPFDAVRAVRIGGVLGCISAAESYGLPVPNSAGDDVHVSLHGNASRLRHSRDRMRPVGADEEEGVYRHWHPRMEAALGWRVGVADALLELAQCVPFEWLVAAMDTALHVPRGGVALISPAAWSALRIALPERLRAAHDLADGRAESPIETILRLGLIRLGIVFDLQVWVLPYHRVDLMIGGWLIIEVDGRSYHVDDGNFEADRERDALLAAWGYRVLRFSYRQVTEDLDWVLDVILAVVRRAHP